MKAVCSFPRLTALVLAVAGCGGGSATPGVTFLSQGSGPSNARPLDPLPVGLRRFPGSSASTVIGTLTTGGQTIKRIDTGDGRSVLWILENDDGQSLYGSTQDGVLAKPVLLVPKTVRVGMKWTSGNTVYTFTVTGAEMKDTIFGKQMVWTTTQVTGTGTDPVSGDPTQVITRSYIEGYGEYSIAGAGGTTTFGSMIIPMEAPSVPVDSDVGQTPVPLMRGGKQALMPPAEPLFFSAIDHGDGTLSIGETGYQSFYENPPGQDVLVIYNDCLSLNSVALTKGCPEAASGNFDLSGALFQDGNWVNLARDGFGQPAEASKGSGQYNYFAFLDGMKQIHTVYAGSGSPDWGFYEPLANGAGVYPLQGLPTLTAPRYSQFSRQTPAFLTPPRVASENGADVLPIGLIYPSGMVTQSLLHVSPAVGHAETQVPAFFVAGTRTVRTSATEREMLIASRDGQINRIVLGAAGPALEKIASVALPVGEELVGALRLTKSGAATADDPLLLFVYAGPPMVVVDRGAILTPAPTKLYTIPHSQSTPAHVVPALAVSALKVNQRDVEVCWPPSLGRGLGANWEIAGAPALVTAAANGDGSCVLLLRDGAKDGGMLPAVLPLDYWHVEGSIPGLGRVAIVMDAAPTTGAVNLIYGEGSNDLLVPLAGGGMVATVGARTGGGVIIDSDGLTSDKPDNPSHYAQAGQGDGGHFNSDAGRGVWYLSFEDPSPGKARAYLVGRTTKGVDLPIVTKCVPHMPCALAASHPYPQQGGGAAIEVFDQAINFGLPIRPAVFAPDGTISLFDPLPQLVTVGGAQILFTAFARLTDGSTCGGAQLAYCLDPAKKLRSADAFATLGGQANPSQWWLPLNDGTFVFSYYLSGSNPGGTLRLDAATMTFSKLDPRPILGQASHAADGTLYGVIGDAQNPTDATLYQLARIDANAFTVIPNTKGIMGFLVDEKIIIITMSTGSPLQRRIPRP